MLEWISTTGGPLILLPKSLLSSWKGAPDNDDGLEDEPITVSEQNDYQRACGVRGDVGVIPVGDGEALVLPEEVLETAWQPLPNGGVLARWVFGDSDDLVEQHLRSLPSSMSWRAGPTFTLSSPELLLFDSAFSGERILTPTLSVSLRAGTYRIGTTTFSPDPRTELILHRLTYD